MAFLLDHATVSRRFIRQAGEELASGDLMQASEKAWGAAAHAMKAMAKSRGWRHSSHRALFAVADRLVAETGRTEIRRMFRIASDTHKNFYEGTLTAEDIASDIAEIKTLTEMLESISNNMIQR